MNNNKDEKKLPDIIDLLLDSSLIITTNKELYNVKVVNCNDYIQVYACSKNNKKSNKNIEKLKDNKNSNNILKDTDLLVRDNNNKSIEQKNIIRSKLECQRLAKCNISDWKTFITLTFAENVVEIKEANKQFRYFIDKIKRVFNEFKYIAIPEFQKRGAVHYHLLTNIDINNNKLVYAQEDNERFKHIKYWNNGFTKVDSLNDNIKKIIGYISKYMTKDIDNRLFNCHRYYYSRNLNKPITSYLNLNNKKHLSYYMKLLDNKEIIYKNEYINPHNNEKIIFKEFL